MRTLLRLTACLTFTALLATAADSKPAVEKAERAFADAIVKADTAALEKLLATDLVYTHSGGNRDTRAVYLDNLRAGKLKYEKMEYQKIEVFPVKADVAFLTARADVRVISGGKPVDMKLSLLHVFVKRQGRWQLLAHQSARLP